MPTGKYGTHDTDTVYNTYVHIQNERMIESNKETKKRANKTREHGKKHSAWASTENAPMS